MKAAVMAISCNAIHKILIFFVIHTPIDQSFKEMMLKDRMSIAPRIQSSDRTNFPQSVCLQAQHTLENLCNMTAESSGASGVRDLISDFLIQAFDKLSYIAADPLLLEIMYIMPTFKLYNSRV